MRLASAILILPALGGQESADLPWRAVDPSNEVVAQGLKATTGPISVRLAADGSLRIFEGKGVRRLRMGLPGRPVKVWRDGGLPLAAFLAPMAFPEDTPLRHGLGSLPLDAPDFRVALQGLLWILDDGERVLTVLHPATCQSIRLRLPAAEGPDLRFLPDRLELRSTEGRAWALPWIALLPQFLQLGRPGPRTPPGSALDPYPKG